MKHIAILTLLVAGASGGAAADYFPLEDGNQWVLESASAPVELINIQVHRSRTINGAVYHFVTGYGATDYWMRSTNDGRLVALDAASNEERLLASLRFGAPSYRTTLGGCEQVATPQQAALPVVDGEETIALPVNYDPGSCRDRSLASEVYGPGSGLLQRSIVTFRGPRNFRLVYAKVNGRVVGTRNRELVLHTDFQYGASGWRGGFSDYSLVSADTRTIAEIRYLPEEAGAERTGFYLQSMNRSDDMFMYLKKVAAQADGIAPNRAYRVEFDIVFQSNAGKGCAGVGGAPGEGVYVKAGATPGEPVSALDRGSFLAMNIDKGFQSTGGRDAGVAGNIANGIDCGGNVPYARVRRSYAHPNVVRTDDRGELWLLVGTDSAYEGLTGIYVEAITVRIKPDED